MPCFFCSGPERQPGYVLITVVVTLFIMSAIVLLLNRESSINVAMVRSQQQAATARYVAEAGMQHAIWSANASNCAGYALPLTSFGTHSYSASFTPTSGSPLSIVAAAQLSSGTSRSLSRNNIAIYQPPFPPMILQPGADGIDTYVINRIGNDDSSNYGSGTQMRFGTGDAHPLINFDFSAVPAGTKILGAELALHFEQADSMTSADLSVHRLTQSWIEGEATWNEYEAGISWGILGGDYDSDVVAMTTVAGVNDTWHRWDITELVSGWVSGTFANNGLLVRVASGNVVNGRFTSSDGSIASNRPKLTITYACECGQACYTPPGLWISTLDDVMASGAPGLADWTDGEALAFADPNLLLEPGTSNGTFSSILNLDGFASDGDADIDAMHYVDNDITVGSANSVDLLTGDVLLSTADNETLSSDNSLSVNDEDVFVFRPTTAGDYSTGSFTFLLDGSEIHTEADTVGVSLVEKATSVGDGALAEGSFIMAISNLGDVMEFVPTDVGEGTSSGSFDQFIKNSIFGSGSNDISGMDLVEDEVSLGSHTIPAGSILLSLNGDGANVADNALAVNSEDIFYLTMTQVGTSPVGDATLLFEGLDVNLDTLEEHVQALTLNNATSAGGGGGGTPCNGTFRDEFNLESYANNDGTLIWATDWIDNESDGPTKGDVRVAQDGTEPVFMLRIKNKNEGVQREADLSGASVASLSFDYRRDGLVGITDNVVIEASDNGDDAGSWQEIGRLQGTATDATYLTANYDLTPYIASNTRIRLVASPDMGKNDIVWFDNIEIQCAP